MFKMKKFWFKVLRNIFALLVCVMFIFASSFSVYSADNYRLQSAYSFSTGSMVPVIPVSATSSKGSDSGSFTYSGEVSLDYYISINTKSPVSFDGYFSLRSNLTVHFYPIVLNTQVYNPIIFSLKEAYIYDVSGTPYPVIQSQGFYYSNAVYTASNFSQLSSSPIISPVLFFRAHDVPFQETFFMHVVFSIQSQCPLVAARQESFVLGADAGVTQYTLTALSSPPSTSAQLNQINQNLDSLENKTDTTNNKLQNLTDGYDNTAINDSNTNLNNSLTEYDQQEDEAISAATDFFTEIKTPISFFDSGTFIAASSFVWQWLQGVYEHLGQAQVVVDVFLALTVAFSFVGLSRYIWRHSGRSSGGSAKGG